MPEKGPTKTSISRPAWLDAMLSPKVGAKMDGSEAYVRHAKFYAWPLACRWVSRHAVDGDAGVGDTLERLLGKTGERYKFWYKRIVGRDCNCENEKQRLNARYPYKGKPDLGGSKPWRYPKDESQPPAST